MISMDVDSGTVWLVGATTFTLIVTFVGVILKMFAEMTIKGLYKRIESCHDKLERQIDDSMRAAVRANQRCDEIMLILLGQSDLGHKYRQTRSEEIKE